MKSRGGNMRWKMVSHLTSFKNQAKLKDGLFTKKQKRSVGVSAEVMIGDRCCGGDRRRMVKVDYYVNLILNREQAPLPRMNSCWYQHEHVPRTISITLSLVKQQKVINQKRGPTAKCITVFAFANFTFGGFWSENTVYLDNSDLASWTVPVVMVCGRFLRWHNYFITGKNIFLQFGSPLLPSTLLPLLLRRRRRCLCSIGRRNGSGNFQVTQSKWGPVTRPRWAFVIAAHNDVNCQFSYIRNATERNDTNYQLDEFPALGIVLGVEFERSLAGQKFVNSYSLITKKVLNIQRLDNWNKARPHWILEYPLALIRYYQGNALSLYWQQTRKETKTKTVICASDKTKFLLPTPPPPPLSSHQMGRSIIRS